MVSFTRVQPGQIIRSPHVNDLQVAIENLDLALDPPGVEVYTGDGSPEGLVIAPPDSIYVQQDAVIGGVYSSFLTGDGSPEGVIAAPPDAVYLQQDASPIGLAPILPFGDDGDILTMVAGAPTWRAPVGIDARDFGVVTDGVTVTTAALQAAFTAAYAQNLPVLLPPGTMLTGTITYKGQSIIGAGSHYTTLKGLPGQDVLHLGSIGTYSLSRGTLDGFTIIVDDSVDASASFPNRDGVGNAGFAVDYPDGAVVTPNRPPLLISYTYRDLRFFGASSAPGGQNNSCGMYTQYHSIVMSACDQLEFWRLRYGWWDDVPRFNPLVTTVARDHMVVGRIYLVTAGTPGASPIGGLDAVSNATLHSSQITGLTLQGAATYISQTTGGTSFGVVFIEDAATPIVFDGDVHTCFFDNLSSNGATNAVDWSGNQCFVRNWNFSFDVNPSVFLTVSGNQNDITIGSLYPDAGTALRTMVVDTGVGNRIGLWRATGSLAGTQRAREIVNADGRMYRHLRDGASGLLGYTTPLFKSGNDLLATGGELVPSSTDWSYENDAANGAAFGMALKVTQASGIWTCSGDSINGQNANRVGSFVPAGKLQIALRIRATTPGTLNLELRTLPDNVLRGSGAPAVAATYSVVTFEVDLTGVAVDTELALRSNPLTGGATSPVWIDWVLFRPRFKDLSIESEAWNGGHIVMGNYHLWIDSTGDLRIKSSAPTSDTDGAVVGTQT